MDTSECLKQGSISTGFGFSFTFVIFPGVDAFATADSTLMLAAAKDVRTEEGTKATTAT